MERRQWSYSSLSTYEKCPLRYYLQKVEGLEDKAGPAANRGVRIHTAIEKYLNHQTDELPPEVFKTFGSELENARENHAEAEYEFALTPEWKETIWDEAWVRGKVDLLMRDEGLIVDFKTGRYYSSHREQASLYALALMISDVVTDAHVEFWYIDLDDVQVWEFPRDMMLRLKGVWEHRANQLAKETEWEPRPNPTCKWCPFSVRRGGQCDH